MPGTYDEIFLNTDVCVVGGGPGGMMAALSSAEQGLRVILMEPRPWLLKGWVAANAHLLLFNKVG